MFKDIYSTTWYQPALNLLHYTNSLKISCSWIYCVTQTCGKLHAVNFTVLHKHAESYMQLTSLCYTNMRKAICSWIYCVSQTCGKLHAVDFTALHKHAESYMYMQLALLLHKHAVDFTVLHKHAKSYMQLTSLVTQTCGKLHAVEFTVLHKHAESYMQLTLLCYTNMRKATCSWLYCVT